MKLEEECKFCNIVTGENPHKIIYQDNHIIGFHNIAQHYGDLQLLWSPIEHLVQEELLTDPDILNRIMMQLTNYAIQEKKDYRLIMNVGLNSGQEIEHAHFHQIFSDKPLSIAPYCYHP